MCTFNYDARVACQKSNFSLCKTVRFSQFSWVSLLGARGSSVVQFTLRVHKALSSHQCRFGTERVCLCSLHRMHFANRISVLPLVTRLRVITHRLPKTANNMWKLNFV